MLADKHSGVAETVQTYPTYLKNATGLFLKAGAKVILSAPTPNNVWESGSYSWGPDRFAYYSWYTLPLLPSFPSPHRLHTNGQKGSQRRKWVVHQPACTMSRMERTQLRQ